MAPATKQRKQQALAWIDQQHPSGATFMFEAMRRALRFSGIDWGTKTITPNGADTMFLLSDGSPSDPSGHPLDEPAIEEGMKRFFSARYWSRMVVHTIGVGPGHHRAVLKKIASESGGTYRGVDDS